MSSPLGTGSFVLKPALDFLGQGCVNDGLLRGLPGAIQGEPKGGGDSATILRFPTWLFQGKKLVVHNGGSVLIEAKHNLYARSTAVNAIMPEPGPLGSGGLEKFSS